MDGKTAIVGIGGLGLVAANYWTGNQRRLLGGAVFTPSHGGRTEAHSALLAVGGELLLVGLLYLLAGASDQLANVAVVLVLTLWVLFAITRSTGAPATSKPTGTHP